MGAPNQQGYTFTSDWFSANIPAWQKIIAQGRPQKILEIGCYEGRATTWLAEHAGASEIHCVDPWVPYADLPGKQMAEVEGRFDANIALASKNHPTSKIHKHKKPSTDALAGFIAGGKRGYFDLVYIDGSHHAPDVLSDAVLAFPLLRTGGTLIFDDYLWHAESADGKNPLFLPKTGIDAFLNVFHGKVRIIGNLPLYQIYARKTAD